MKFIILIIIGLLVYLAVMFDNLHTEGYKKCQAVNGVWLDKEMKCVGKNETPQHRS